jgi:hypothetical protein
MKTAAVFKQADLDRIFKAAKRAGVGARLKPDGSVEVLPDSVPEAQGQSKLREKVFGRGAQA